MPRWLSVVTTALSLTVLLLCISCNMTSLDLCVWYCVHGSQSGSAGHGTYFPTRLQPAIMLAVALVTSPIAAFASSLSSPDPMTGMLVALVVLMLPWPGPTAWAHGPGVPGSHCCQPCQSLELQVQVESLDSTIPVPGQSESLAARPGLEPQAALSRHRYGGRAMDSDWQPDREPEPEARRRRARLATGPQRLQLRPGPRPGRSDCSS